MAPPQSKQRNYCMEIDGGSGSAMRIDEPRRISQRELEWREYRLRWRAADAGNKMVAARHRQDNIKWRSMSKTRLIQEELFFSNDIDFSRIKLTDAPAPAPAPRVVVPGKKRKSKRKPKHHKRAGGATSPGIKLCSTPSQSDLVSVQQMHLTEE